MVVAVYAWESGQTAGHTHDTVVPRSVHIVLGLREGFKEAALASFRLLAYSLWTERIRVATGVKSL